nr:hypothetical protein [Tanacetum cinerariifolium]
MTWLDYDEHVDSLSTMDNKVGVTSPKSTTQTLPSFDEYTPPMTYLKEVKKTLGTLIEVEPLNETKLEEVGLNCNQNTPFSSREVPSFDGPEPQPLLNSPSFDVSLGDVRGPEPPIKPHSLDSSRMKVVEYLTTQTLPLPHIECTYKDYLNCRPLKFNGTEGVIGLTRWFERTKSVSSISNCTAKNFVKFASCTLIGSALTWWNSHMRAVSQVVSYAMPWKTLRQRMTANYTLHFQELTLLCGRMFLEESDEIERYVGGLPEMIRGNVMSYELKSMQKAIEFANDQMDKNLHGISDRQAKNKRKFDHTSRNQQNQQPFKRNNNVVPDYAAGSGEKPYRGTKPLQAANTNNNNNNNNYNNQRATAAYQGVPTCFECGAQGHFKNNCLKLGNKNHENQNQSGNGNDVARAYGLGTAGGNPYANVVTATSSQAWLWHRRLSHLNFDTINLLSKNDIVVGLPKLKFVKDHLCSSYELGKAKRKSFHTKLTPSSKRRELKKLIEKLKGKYVDTKIEKSSVIRQPNTFKSPRPSVLGKPTTFSNSFIRTDFSKSTSVAKNNVSNYFSKPVTAQTWTATKKPCLKNTNVLTPGMYKIRTAHTQATTSKLPQDSKKTNKNILRSNSGGKKLEVEEPRRNVKLLKNKMSVTACTDSLNVKTVNETSVSAMCAKSVMIKKHDLRVPKSVAKPLRKPVASESIKKPRNNVRKPNEHFGKIYKWTYIRFTPSGYMWKTKSKQANVNQNVSMPLANASRTTNVKDTMTYRRSTVSNTPLSSNSFAAHRDCLIHRRLWE